MRCLQAFSEDEGLQRDTTAVQLAAGRDIQGIPWELTQYDRASYRVGGWFFLFVCGGDGSKKWRCSGRPRPQILCTARLAASGSAPCHRRTPLPLTQSRISVPSCCTAVCTSVPHREQEVRTRGYVSYFNREEEVRLATPAIAAEAVKHPPGAGEHFYAFYRCGVGVK